MIRVAIVGGGAAGVLAAAHLRRSKPEIQITLIDASGRPGTGAAYGTNDPAHLLNVPAHRMSAWPDDPDHFCRWLDERAVTPAESFAPRLAYSRYLREQLAGADVRIETAEVVGLVPGTSTQVKLNDGRSLSADAVVLAPGRPEGSLPEPLERAFAPVLAAGTDDKVVVDPWAPGALAALGARRPRNVLVIGSGLTGVDVALHLIARGATVTMLSRHGALPHTFRDTGAPAELPQLDALGDANTLEQVRAALGTDLERARDAGLNWRQVIDAVRPRTARLALAGLGGPTSFPARGLAAVGGPAPSHAADDRRRNQYRDRPWPTDHRGWRSGRCIAARKRRRAGRRDQRGISSTTR